MEGRCIGVCAIAGVLGLIAVVMGFAAEDYRIKANQVELAVDGSCIYPNSPSMAMGIAASIFLLIEQILISSVIGCVCCTGTLCPSTCKGITALVCFIFSWLVFVGAFLTLMYGAMVNNTNTLAKAYIAHDKCPLGSSNIFIVGGVLCVISITLGLIPYIALMSSDKESNRRGSGVEHRDRIATAKPQMPMKV